MKIFFKQAGSKNDGTSVATQDTPQKKPKFSKTAIVLLGLATLACVASLALALNKPTTIDKEMKALSVQIKKIDKELAIAKEKDSTDNKAEFEKIAKETADYKKKTEEFNEKERGYAKFGGTPNYQIMQGLNDDYRSKESKPEIYASDDRTKNIENTLEQLKGVGLDEDK